MDFLANVRDVLSPKGFRILDVPDGDFRIANSILGSIVPEHPNYFGSMNLRRVLSASGFSDIDLRPYKGSLKAKAKKGGLKGGLVKPNQRQISVTYEALKTGTKESIGKYKFSI